jgi:DNA-binding MarR family transcriptional regulator
VTKRLAENATLRPSAALLSAHIAVSTAIERRAVAATSHDSTTIDLLLRIALSPDQQLRGADLCQQLRLNAGYISRRLDRAEAAGLLTRRPATTDRRAQTVALTADGQRVVDDFVPRLNAVIKAVIYETLDTDETETLIDLLTRVEHAAVALLDQPTQN